MEGHGNGLTAFQLVDALSRVLDGLALYLV
jgi:hypothetical protein